MITKDDIKFYIYIAVTIAGATMYFNSAYATKAELLQVQSDATFSKKVLCLIAYRLKDDVKEKESKTLLTDNEFKEICGINLK